MSKDVLNTKEAAAEIGVAVSTLKRWRKEGKGPKFIRQRLGRGQVYYRTDDIKSFKEELFNV